MTGILSDVHVVLDGRRIDLPWYGTDLYICGPGDLCETVVPPVRMLGDGHQVKCHLSLDAFARMDPVIRIAAE